MRTADRSVQPRSSQASGDYAQRLQLFFDEARTLARINHTNLVRVHAYVEANGTGYIVTDYIEGETLDDRLKREGKLDRFHLTAILKRWSKVCSMSTVKTICTATSRHGASC